ncbi:MAG: carbohydrate kinase family protein [Anaerolineae bacterium]|nr:carbohydrate kinase family protein [Anaerolineae bacterium]
MEIILTGSIAYDYLMRYPGRFSEHFIRDELHQVSLSFLVEEMTKHWGGVGANIAYTLAMLGVRPKLMGTVGRDFGDYREWLESNGVDCSTVTQLDSVFTASFFANTDLDNNQIASFYAGAMTHARNYRIRDVYIGKPDLVVVSPNDPTAMSQLTQECRDYGWRFIYDPSQQVPRLSGEELLRDMQGAYVMVVNAYEAGVICKKTNMTMDQLRKQVEVLVVTQGKRGSHIYTQDEFMEVPVFPEVEIKDPTGVGDAFRAGLIRGIVGNWPIKTSALVGSLCATYVLEKVGTQSHHFDLEEFVARFREKFDDQGVLDQLLQRVK